MLPNPNVCSFRSALTTDACFRLGYVGIPELTAVESGRQIITLLLLKNPGQCMGTEQVDQAQSFVLLCPHHCPLSGPVFAGEVGKQQHGTRAANGPLHLGVHCKSLFSLTLSRIHDPLESSYCDSHYGGCRDDTPLRIVHTVDFWGIGLHCGSKRLALPMRVPQYYQCHL